MDVQSIKEEYNKQLTRRSSCKRAYSFVQSIKEEYNKQLSRFRVGEEYINKNYSIKAHKLLIEVGVRMQGLLDDLAGRGVEVSMHEAWYGFEEEETKNKIKLRG